MRSCLSGGGSDVGIGMTRHSSLLEMLDRYLERRARNRWMNYWIRRGMSQHDVTQQWEEKLPEQDREDIVTAELWCVLGNVGLIALLFGVIMVGLAFLPALWRASIAGGLFLLGGGLLAYQKRWNSGKRASTHISPSKLRRNNRR